jgi:hypothetical protein
MSLLHESIDKKKFDTRVVDKNLVRSVVTDAEYKQFVAKLADDSENALYIGIEDIEASGSSS